MPRPVFGRPETGRAPLAFPETPLGGTQTAAPLSGDIITRCANPARTRAGADTDPSRFDWFDAGGPMMLPPRGDGTPCYRCVANHAPMGSSGRVACHMLRGTADGCTQGDTCTTVHAAPVAEPATRHAPEALRCSWLLAGTDEGEGCAMCDRLAVVVYEAPSGSGFPRCRRHDTVAAQRRADADGWTRRAVQEGS